MNIKHIKEQVVVNKFDRCIEEAKIAEFAGKNDEALNWYYRALYFEIYKNTDDSNRIGRINVLRDGYEKKIIELGGNWPKQISL